MHDLFRQGAFQGSTPAQTYFIKCDAETTTPDDLLNGVVNILIGFASIEPAEFLIMKIRRSAQEMKYALHAQPL